MTGQPQDADLQVGDVRIVPIYDGFSLVPARTTILRRSEHDPWAEHQELLRPDGTLLLPMGGFLVLDGDRRILVDTGLGPMSTPTDTGGQFLQSLSTAGYTPSDITDVLFTHLHSDHTGWAVHAGATTFPNATYRVHAADWSRYGANRTTLSAIGKQLRLFDTDGPVSTNFRTQHSPGHTPGSTVFVISSGNERALLIGDVAHSPVQFSAPDWETVWDTDPTAAAATRNAIADDAASTGALVVPAHFPGLRGGHVVNRPRRFILNRPSTTISDRLAATTSLATPTPKDHRHGNRTAEAHHQEPARAVRRRRVA